MSFYTQFTNLFTRKPITMPANTTEAPVHPAGTSTNTSFQFDPNTFLTDIEEALTAANTFLPTMLPIIGEFYAPAAALVKFLPLISVALNAVNQVQAATGQTASQATTAVAQHLTPGQPNAPALN